MNLVYFTQEAYATLKTDITQNQPKYYSSDYSWLKEYFEEKNQPDWFITSSVRAGNIELLYSGADDATKNTDDFHNTRIFYTEYMDKITPSQATDPLLWTALCHLVFHDYILKRWKKPDGTVTVSQRFFATESRDSLLYYNAISRLWWCGYLTYEEEKKRTNPWELTKVLFSAQQNLKDLIDQPFSMNRSIVKGLLRALKRIQEETGNAATTAFRSCCDSYINHYGAVTVLDALSSDEIEAIAYNHMKGIVEGK